MTGDEIPIGAEEDQHDVASAYDELQESPAFNEIAIEDRRSPRQGTPRPWYGINVKGEVKGGKEQKQLLSTMTKMIPWKYGDGSKPIQITPLVQMYLVRYLGPYLYEYTDAALSKKRIQTKRKASSRKEIEARMKSLIRQAQLDNQGRLTNIPLAADSDMDLDIIFPFNRIKTLLKTKDTAVEGYEFGLLQQYYSSLSGEEKGNFNKFFLQTLRGKLVPEQKEGGILLPKEDYIQPFLGLIETRGGEGETKTKVIKFLDDPAAERPIAIRQGGSLLSHGLNILLAEVAGAHKFAEAMLPDNINFEEIDRLEGVGYLTELIVQIYLQDEDGDIEEARTILHEMFGNQYSLVLGSVATEGYSAIIMDEDKEIRTNINIHPKTNSDGDKRACLLAPKQSKNNLNLSKNPVPGLVILENLCELMLELCTSPEVKYETESGDETRNFDEEEISTRRDALVYMLDMAIDEGKISAIDINSHFIHSANIAFDNGLTGFCTIIDEEGMTEGGALASEVEEFNAMGQLIEQIMLDNAIKASIGTSKIQSATRYDETINGLVGNSTFIGIATYHAALHFNLLFAQLKTPFKNWNVESQEVVGGRLLAVEAYFGDPAKLLLYWMLNFRDYLDWGSTGSDGTPQFFKAPEDTDTQEAISAYERNKLAHVILAYYRLSFAMLATKEVFTGKKKPKGSADIKEYWKKLIKDAKDDPPSSTKFVQMLAYSFGNLKDKTQTMRDVPHPTWMPPPAEVNISPSKQESSELVTKYLKWAYGQRPINIEWFGEVAAVYHAAKAISISNDYPKIVTTFVEAVSQDGGHPFLFSILLNPKSERETIPEAPPSKIVITDIEKIGGSGRIKARFDKGGTGGGEATGVDPPPSDPPPSDPPSTETAEDADADADPTAGTFEGSDTPTVTTQTRDAMLAVLEMVDAGADPSAIHEFLREAAEEDASLNPYTGAAFVDMDPENWRAIAQPILDAESLDVDEGLDFAPEDFGGD